MATILFKFVFYDSSSPQVTLTSTELTGGDAPTVNISTTAFADGTVASVVSGGALTYDTYTKTWHYRLTGADLSLYLYVAKATTTYATAIQVDTHALGQVIPDVLPSTLATAASVAALNDVSVSDILTTQMTEDYAADGTAPTVAQALHQLLAFLQERSVSGTTVTVKKLDGSTTAMTFTLDDGSSPSSITRAS